MINASYPIAVAIDESELITAQELVQKLAGEVGWLKLGMEFFFAQGRAGYEHLARLGLPVFLDLKLHDIPNSVASALDALMRLDPRPGIVNVHASGGRRMMEAAADAVSGRAKLIAVTVLTSLEEKDLAEIGLGKSAVQTMRSRSQNSQRVRGLMASSAALMMWHKSRPCWARIFSPSYLGLGRWAAMPAIRNGWRHQVRHGKRERIYW